MLLKNFNLTYEEVDDNKLLKWIGSVGWAISNKDIAIIYDKDENFEVIVIDMKSELANQHKIVYRDGFKVLIPSLMNKELNISDYIKNLFALGYKKGDIVNLKDSDKAWKGLYLVFEENDVLYISPSKFSLEMQHEMVEAMEENK